MNKIAIRVDANEIVATGHIMRCRTIAGSLQQMGCTVVFVSADNNIEPYVRGDFNYHVLESDWRKMEEEIIALLDFLHEEEINRILVDSYYATPEYIRMLEGRGIKVMYIDDMQKEVFPGFYQWPGKACYYVNQCRAKITRVVEGLGPSMTRDRIVRQQVG